MASLAALIGAAPLWVMTPADSRRSSSRAWVPPSAATKLRPPLPVARRRVRGVPAASLSTVLANWMVLVPPPVLMVTGPVRVVADAKVTSAPLVVMSPAVLMPPPAVMWTAPSALMSPDADSAVVPL